MKNGIANRPKMATVILFLLASLAVSSPGVAQVCAVGDLELTSQAEVDSFQADYGPCDVHTSALGVSGADIANLAGLSALVEIGSDLRIHENPLLTNLDDLSALTTVGGELSVYLNSGLTSIAGLSQLTSVSWLRIQENDALTNLDGLQGVTSVDRLNIPLNDVLANVDGLSSLMSVGSEVNITGNAALTNLDGLSALASVAGHFYLQSNQALTDIGGLSSLTSIGGAFTLLNNDSLPNVDGLSSLISIGDTLNISGNDALLNLDGLSLLISVGNDVRVVNNASLALCSGLEALLDDVDDGAPGPGPGTAGIPDVGDEVELSGNLPGCNSLPELFGEPATFLVTKTYSDGNLDAVEVTLSCNTGLPLIQSFTISDGEPVNFVVTNFAQGAMDCEVTETGTANGYSPSYDNGSAISTTSCAYAGVVSGAYECAITNNADPATFTVTKQWLVSGAEGHEVVQEASVAIYCNNEIEGGSWNGSYYVLSDVLIGDGDSLVATVDTLLQSAQCWAEENIVQSGVETENNCGERTIPAGGSSSCTIINTVFFEGIPTMSRWGLALMALLMLGVGIIGVRRFG